MEVDDAKTVRRVQPRETVELEKYLRWLIDTARELHDEAKVAETERELAHLRDSDPTMVALDARLAAVIKRDLQPKDGTERLKLAQRAYDKTLHATAARLWAEAIEADPKLGDDRNTQHRYNAACAAALAGSGQGKDEPPPDEAVRAKQRDQARAWLRAELAAWAKVLDAGPGPTMAMIVPVLQHWKADPDLSGIRDEKELARLPEEERGALKGLWTDVEALLAKAKATPAGTK
jgi:hypothetical protein